MVLYDSNALMTLRLLAPIFTYSPWRQNLRIERRVKAKL